MDKYSVAEPHPFGICRDGRDNELCARCEAIATAAQLGTPVPSAQPDRERLREVAERLLLTLNKYEPVTTIEISIVIRELLEAEARAWDSAAECYALLIGEAGGCYRICREKATALRVQKGGG